jgi:hypothetical protein
LDGQRVLSLKILPQISSKIILYGLLMIEMHMSLYDVGLNDTLHVQIVVGGSDLFEESSKKR